MLGCSTGMNSCCSNPSGGLEVLQKTANSSIQTPTTNFPCATQIIAPERETEKEKKGEGEKAEATNQESKPKCRHRMDLLLKMIKVQQLHLMVWHAKIRAFKKLLPIKTPNYTIQCMENEEKNYVGKQLLHYVSSHLNNLLIKNSSMCYP